MQINSNLLIMKYLLLVSLFICIGESSISQPIDLEFIWARVGDSYGKLNIENTTESVECAVFSPAENYIASGAKKGWEVTLWETATGDKVWQQKADEEIEVVDFTQDGKQVIAAGEDNKIRIYETLTGNLEHTIDNIAAFDAMDLSNQNHLLAVGDEAGQILLFDTRTWKRLDLVKQGEDQHAGGQQGTDADVNQLYFSPDDQYLLSAGRNHQVKLWQISDDQKLLPVRNYEGHAATVKSVRLSSDGKYVAAGAGGGNGVRIWDFETGDLLHHLPGTGMIMETVAFTPDGKYLFTGGNEGEGKIGEEVENAGFENNDGMGHIYVYKAPEEGKRKFELVLKKPVFRQEFFDFSNDGKLLVTSHEDGTVRLWGVVRN